jgi:hypothetical protein
MPYTAGQLADRLRTLADQVDAFGADAVPRPALDADVSTLESWARKHGTQDPHPIDQVEPHALNGENTFAAMIAGTDDYHDEDAHGLPPDAETIARRFRENPLDVQQTGKDRDTLEILEGTGGPADGYVVTFDPDTGAIERARYWFQDWFEPKAFIELARDEYPATFAYLSWWTAGAALGDLDDA